MPPVSVKLPQTVAAPAGNGGPSVSTEQQDQADNCFNSSGPSTYQYGALDTLGGTIKPGRATWAQACLVPPTTSGSRYVPNFPGFNGTIMDRAHLIARQFGGTGGRSQHIRFDRRQPGLRYGAATDEGNRGCQ